MPDQKETLGDRIRRAREAKKLTQRELAEIAGGISQQTLNNLETGISKSTGQLVPLALALGVKPEYLYYGKLTKIRLPSDKSGPIALENALIIGSVAAGVWRETKLTAPATKTIGGNAEVVPYLPTTKYADLVQYGLRVEGGGMSSVVAPGEYVSIVLVEDGATPTLGDIVVVQREKAGLYELTLKRFAKQSGDTIVLEPESEQEGYAPLIINSNGNGDVQIVAVAIGKYQPF